MNTKKAVWINKPAELETKLHSFRFLPEKESSVFFILGEEGEMRLSVSGGDDYAFVLLHTDREFISFHDNECIMEMNGLHASFHIEAGREIKLMKKGSRLEFTGNDRVLLSVEKTGFADSVSFGLTAAGNSKIILEVF